MTATFPPQDSVRVEEYVNYFDHGYASPPAHQGFGIYGWRPVTFHRNRSPRHDAGRDSG
ncbi:MAG: von Willebrand factor type A domain-containing protein [Anaerolineales bacterium]|nr:von Willebrand factor type A domain-containing protein [Anaerolineales bacterium]